MSLRNRILSLCLLAVAALTITLISHVLPELNNRSEKQKLLSRVMDAEKISAMIYELQRERGLSAGYLGIGNEQDLATLKKQRAATDTSISTLATTRNLNLLDVAELADYRDKINLRQIPVHDSMKYYSSTIKLLLGYFNRFSQQANAPADKGILSAHAHIMYATEYLGLMRASLMVKAIRNEDIVAHGNLLGHFEENREFSISEAPQPTASLLEAAFFDTRVQTAIEVINSVAAHPEKTLGKFTPEKRFSIFSGAIDSLIEGEAASVAQFKKQITDEISAATLRLTAMIGAVLAVIAALVFIALTTIRKLEPQTSA